MDIFYSKYLDPTYLFEKGSAFVRELFGFLGSDTSANVYNGIITVLSIFFFSVIAYVAVRMREIRRKEAKHLAHEIAEYAHHQAEKEKKVREGEGISKNERWRKVLEYIFSTNANDWKLGIIEADSMLEALMGDLGFKGANLGEKLKSADRESFRGLSLAWEAHGVRNRIAHEGASFNLSHHEAKRIIALYEGIFREFGYI